MLVHANKEELLLLAKSFYNVSHTLLSIYDANKELICSYPNRMCLFCREVRKSAALTEKCMACDLSALEKCAETHDVYAYKCHMGLLEVAAPIMQNDLVIGYMLFGQITDNRDKTPLLAGLEETADRYGLDRDLLKEGIQKIKYRSPEYIASISKIMEMCASYVWQNSIITVKNDTIAYVLDLFIQENLHANVTVEMLCKQFHISRSTLYTIAKKHFGCGISNYIAACRIARAKELLSAGEMSVTEIAVALGMENVSYFVRFFKKQVGVTPKKYATTHRHA